MNNTQYTNRSIPQNVTVEGLKLALEEMQSLYAMGLASAEQLDVKAGTIFSSASLILTLVTTLQLTLAGTNQPWFYWAGLIIVFLLYISMIALTLFALSPRVFTTPIEASWEVLDQWLFQATEKQSLLNLISGYTVQIHENEKVLNQKATIVKLATILLAFIVSLLLVLSMVVAR